MSLFVGPSYNLNTRKADVQRVVNMMPTPVEAAGGKSNSYLAPVPGLSEFSEPATGDPFWDEVIYLLPLSDRGTNFTDYSPLQNPVSLIGSGAATFTQDSTHKLFGRRTLRIEKANGQEDKNLYFRNTTKTFASGDDIVIEGFFRVIANGGSVPLTWLQRRDPGDPVIAVLPQNPGSDIWFREIGLSGSGFIDGGNTTAQWHYFAMQYIAADLKTYCYIGPVSGGTATKVHDLPTSLGSITGFRLYAGTTINSVAGSGTSLQTQFNLAQLRGTKANRYGNVSSISIPTAPFPTFGT